MCLDDKLANVSCIIYEVSTAEEGVRQKVGAFQKGARLLIVIGIEDSVPTQMQWQEQSLDQEGTFLVNWFEERSQLKVVLGLDEGSTTQRDGLSITFYPLVVR